MERIYNKLKKHSLAELKQILGSLNVDTSKCKTKNDYIRLFIRKQAKGAKLIPKISKNSFRSDRSDHSRVSQASVCIIKQMENDDISRIDKYLDKHRKDRYVPDTYSILYSKNPVKRQRSIGKITPIKRIKTDENSDLKAESKARSS